jgi:hypothetical protein
MMNVTEKKPSEIEIRLKLNELVIPSSEHQRTKMKRGKWWTQIKNMLPKFEYKWK